MKKLNTEIFKFFTWKSHSHEIQAGISMFLGKFTALRNGFVLEGMFGLVDVVGILVGNTQHYTLSKLAPPIFSFTVGILALSCYFVLLCLTNVTWGRTRMLMTLISYVRRGEQIILYDWWQMTVLSNRILGTYGFFKESHALRLDYITAVYRVWPWKILIPADRDVTELLNNEGWKKVHTESE